MAAIKRPSKKNIKAGAIKPPTPENFKVTQLIDPSSAVWGNLGIERQREMYKVAVNRTNSKIAYRKKQAGESDFIYKSLKFTNTIIPKTGNVGFSREGVDKWTYPKLKAEYEKVYRIYHMTSYKKSVEAKVEETADQMAHMGIDFDTMAENPVLFKDFLNDWWYLWQELENLGVWEKLGLDSFTSQEFLREYWDETQSLPKGEAAAHRLARDINRRLNVVAYDAKEHAQANGVRDKRKFDAYVQKTLYLDYTEKKTSKVRDRLLAKMAEKAYGTEPIESSFENLGDGVDEYTLT